MGSARCGFFWFAAGGDFYFAQRRVGFGVFDEIGHGGVGKGFFDGGQGVIEFAVQRAEIFAVGLDAQWTGVDAMEGVHSIDDVKQGDGVRLAGEGEPAVKSALGGDQVCPAKRLKDLGKIAGGDLGAFGHILGGLGRVRIKRKMDDGTQSVFNGL